MAEGPRSVAQNRKARHDYFIEDTLEAGMQLLGSEVNPVAQTLHANGIDVAAIHQHHLAEQPKLTYMHFWANDDPAKLAQGLRAAIDQTNSAAAQVPGIEHAGSSDGKGPYLLG